MVKFLSCCRSKKQSRSFFPAADLTNSPGPMCEGVVNPAFIGNAVMAVPVEILVCVCVSFL